MLKQGFIFDLDGTLVDSEPIHFEAYKQALKEIGADLKLEDFINTWLEKGAGMPDFFAKYKIKGDLAKSRQRKCEIFLDIVPDNLAILPGAEKLLSYLENNDKPCVLASGSNSNEISAMLQKTGLTSYFQFIIGVDHVARNKPEPDIFNLALRKLNLLSTQCLIFENTTNGVVAANKAGIKCVAIPSEYSKDFDFSAADYLFSSLEELTPEVLIRL